MHRNVLIAACAVPAGLIAVAGFWFLIGDPAIQAARKSTGYAAKSVCSCVFVDARDLPACRADLGPKYEPMNITLDRDGRFVRARAVLMSSDTARFTSGYGCRLE